MSDPLNLDGSYEWSGHWWLPGNPDNKVDGALRYDKHKGLELSLIGGFDDRSIERSSHNVTTIRACTQEWDVIFGNAEDCKITLIDGAPRYTPHRVCYESIKLEKQIIVAEIALVGAHVNSENEPKFSIGQVSVENLGSWAVSSRPFCDSDVFGVRVKSDSGEEFALGRYPSDFVDDGKPGMDVNSITNAVYMQFSSPIPYSLGSAISRVQSIQSLITFAAHRAAGVIWLRLKTMNLASSFQSDKAALTVDVIYPPNIVGNSKAEDVERRHMLLACDSAIFERVILGWLDVCESLLPATNLLLVFHYASDRYIESLILMAVGAAEALHQSLGIDELPMPKEVFGEIRENMLTQAPKDLRPRFKSMIQNRMTLRERLLALAARPDQQAVSKIVLDVELWAKKAVRARNELAHTAATKNHSLEELFAIVEVTRAVVTLNILHELGVSPERQREIVERNRWMRGVVKQSKHWFKGQDDESPK